MNIVLPTKKTKFEKVKVKKEEAIEFIKEAKKKFRITIGCMRPRTYDEELIKIVREIALPKIGLLKIFPVEIRNYCCGIKNYKLQ